MNSTFNPTEYWLHRGKGYINERERLSAPFYLEQEELILDAVGALIPGSILEFGCGFGRITKRLAAIPGVTILGVDVSPDQIASARQYCSAPSASFAVGNAVDALIHGRDHDFDIVLAIELLLHITPADLPELVTTAFDYADVFIHDFDRDPKLPLADHVFAHDYAALYESMCFRFEVLERGPYSLMVVRA